MKTFILGVLVFTLIAVLGSGISAESETSGLGAETSDFAGLDNAQSNAEIESDRSKRATEGTNKRVMILNKASLREAALKAPLQIQKFSVGLVTSVKELVKQATNAVTKNVPLANFLSGDVTVPGSCCELLHMIHCRLDMYELKELGIILINVFTDMSTYASRQVAASLTAHISSPPIPAPMQVGKGTKRGANPYQAKKVDYDLIPGEETTEVEHLAADLANAARVILYSIFGSSNCLDEITFLINSFTQAELWYLASGLIRIAENKPGLQRTWVATVLIKALKANCIPVIRKWESTKYSTATPSYGYGIPPVSQYNAEVPALVRKAFGDKCNPQIFGYIPTIQLAQIWLEMSNNDKEECPEGGYDTPDYKPPTSYAPTPSYTPATPSYAPPPTDYPAPDYPASDYSEPTPDYNPPPYKKKAEKYPKPGPSYKPPTPMYNKKPDYKPPYKEPEYKEPEYNKPEYKAPKKYSTPTPPPPPPPTYEYSEPQEYPAPEPETYESYPAVDADASYPTYPEPSYDAPAYTADTQDYTAPYGADSDMHDGMDADGDEH